MLISTDSELVGKFTGTVNSSTSITQTFSFDPTHQHFTSSVTVTNVSSTDLDDVLFMRSFDPDNTVYQGGEYITVNTIDQTFEAGDDAVMVSRPASQTLTPALVVLLPRFSFFASADSRAEVYTGGFTNQNPYDFRSYDQIQRYDRSCDQAIGIIFNLGSLAAGESTSFVYNTSLTTIEASTQVIEQINSTEWSFDPADPAYDYLAVGESLVIPVTYSVTDTFDAVATESFDIVVACTNDPVTSSGSLLLNANEVGTSSLPGTAQQGHDPSGVGDTSLLQNNADLDASDVLRITHVQAGTNSP